MNQNPTVESDITARNKALITKLQASICLTSPTGLLYSAAKEPLFDALEVLSGICYLCGNNIEWFGIPITSALKDTFMNNDTAVRPDGIGFCSACAFSFQEKITINGKEKQKFRNYSHLVADDNWQAVTKADKNTIKEFLLTPHSGWWLACLSDSGQKHLLFRCPVNYGSNSFRVLLEERVIETSREILERLILPIQKLLDLGASKAAIGTGSYHQAFLLKNNLDSVIEYERTIGTLRGCGSFALALWLAQKESNE